jgi:hypothetical protein
MTGAMIPTGPRCAAATDPDWEDRRKRCHYGIRRRLDGRIRSNRSLIRLSRKGA